MHKAVVSFCILCATALPALSQTGVDRESLQRRCSEQASDYFDRAYKPLMRAGNQQKAYSYDSHYNSARKRCYALVTATSQKGGTDYFLKDVSEDKMVGGLLAADRNSCRVEQRKCASEKEFQTLVKPLMEQ
jgi:hypothetical protein